jgi:hypothetical protein
MKCDACIVSLTKLAFSLYSASGRACRLEMRNIILTSDFVNGSLLPLPPRILAGS